MAETVLVRPWPGLILDGIPHSGAELPTALAEMWLADRLVVRVAEAAPPLTTESPAKAAGRTQRSRK